MLHSSLAMMANYYNTWTVIGDSMVRNVEPWLHRFCRVYSYGGLDLSRLSQKLDRGEVFPGRKFLIVIGICMLHKHVSVFIRDLVELLHKFESLHPGAEIHVCEL